MRRHVRELRPYRSLDSTAAVRSHLRFLWLLLDPVVLAVGLAVHHLTKRTPLLAAVSMRRLYVRTDGRLNDVAGRLSSAFHPPVPVDRTAGVLGDLDAWAIDAIARDIDQNGYHVFETKLDSGVCERIVEFARQTPATLRPAPTGRPAESVYDPASPLAPRYDFSEDRIFELEELQELATDQTLMAVAQAYLNCRPINDLVAMWWSPPYGSTPSSEAAQLFHFDMDRFKFVKFFVYLTDVDQSHGPHVYVRSSHIRKPKAVRRDGRIPDEDIVRQYSQEGIVEITGERGTLLAVDTRGFHKGKAPESGDRLLFQVEYANSLFGVPYNRIAVEAGWSEHALEQLKRYPAIFQRFELPAAPMAV
jgi:Phytanoyl-CoA dioxygenase (PhyH)